MFACVIFLPLLVVVWVAFLLVLPTSSLYSVHMWMCLCFRTCPCTWSCAKAGYRADESDPTERKNLRRWQAWRRFLDLNSLLAGVFRCAEHGGRRGGWLLPRVHPCGCVLVVSHVRLMWYTAGEEKGSEGLQASIPFSTLFRIACIYRVGRRRKKAGGRPAAYPPRPHSQAKGGKDSKDRGNDFYRARRCITNKLQRQVVIERSIEAPESYRHLRLGASNGKTVNSSLCAAS